MYSDNCDPWLVISDPLSYLSLVLCCDIYRSTLISIMYPACMITIHDRKSRALQRGREGDNGEIFSRVGRRGCSTRGKGRFRAGMPRGLSRPNCRFGFL